jgi:hypothetical protein
LTQELAQQSLTGKKAHREGCAFSKHHISSCPNPAEWLVQTTIYRDDGVKFEGEHKLCTDHKEQVPRSELDDARRLKPAERWSNEDPAAEVERRV